MFLASVDKIEASENRNQNTYVVSFAPGIFYSLQPCYCVISRQVALASSGSLLEMQTLRPHSRVTEAEFVF